MASGTARDNSSVLSRVTTLFRTFISHYREVKNAEALAEKNRAVINGLLNSATPIKVEFGAGANRGIPGWTYVDHNDQCDLCLDLSNPLPFPDSSVDMIYSSHLLEHFFYADLLHFLSECLRILKPCGVFSAAVPNARIYLEAYQNPSAFDAKRFCYYEPALHYHSRIDYVNYMAYMEGHHRFMFDEENLVALLIHAGFRNVHLRGFDPLLDLEFRDHESLYALCEK